MSDDKREKTGGRVAGTPNKRTLVLADLLEEHGHDPALELVKVSQECDIRYQEAVAQAEEGGKLVSPGVGFWLELKADVNRDLMQYLFPKRKAVEIKTEDPSKENFKLSYSPESLAEFKRKRDEQKKGE
ncbi:MAG: hypothetical protein J7501_03880 [Bdellovibrio sp.]|nr:hypothetical protein [Bdellovibrio sp.]